VAVVVNALGDIFQDGAKIAGMTTADRKGFVSAEQALLMNQYADLITGNTTIAAVFTNARLSVSDLQKVANIASTGMARCIRPVFTMADGDTVYAISLSDGDVQSDVNTIGVLASLVMEKAIARMPSSPARYPMKSISPTFDNLISDTQDQKSAISH